MNSLDPRHYLSAPRTLKLGLMSFTTLGIYLIYWRYKNWSILKGAGRTSAPAPVCGFFLPLTLFSLLDKIESEVQDSGRKRSRLTASADRGRAYGMRLGSI